MAVEVVDVRKVVVIGWDTEIVEGKTASVQANGKELRVVPNSGKTNVFYPLDWTGSTDFLVKGSARGEDSGTIFVTGQEDSEGPDGPEIPDNGGGAVSATNTAEHVFYNDGSDPNIYAIVTQDNGDGTYNLFTLPAQGDGAPVNSVPQREPEEYGDEGGGHTWHSARI